MVVGEINVCKLVIAVTPNLTLLSSNVFEKNPTMRTIERCMTWYDANPSVN